MGGLGWIGAGTALLAAACGGGERAVEASGDRAAERERMVAEQVEARGVRDARVLAALRRVPRHAFVPQGQRALAYADHPLPIGAGQTISQPFVVASMSAAADVQDHERVLEVGTGSGYQAAVLAELAREVYTVEIVQELALDAARALAEQGYDNVHPRTGDGYRGWPEAAPFDAIVVTAAPDHVPEALKQQLAVGGRLVIPVGGFLQELQVIERTPAGFTTETLYPVRFVPMTGEAQDR